MRGVAEGHDPEQLKVADICSPELATVEPHESVEDAVQVMGDQALRRLPVVEGGKAVGIVSLGGLALGDLALGDLAILKAGWRQRVRSSSYLPRDDDPASTLADISAAAPNA